tara:strand:- start:4519 stop:6285 length:1767 start_codon:yes stop_codon:yes gene_type:complete
MNNLHRVQKFLIDNNLDAYILFRADEFLNEHIAPYAERLKWISNFSGSAGKIIIKRKIAAIFVDGRYVLQANKEVNKKYFTIQHLKNLKIWLKNNLHKKMIIGLNPQFHSKIELELIKKITYKLKAKIKFLEENPIDKLWINQPKIPASQAFIHLLKYSGKSTEQKIKLVQTNLRKNKCDYFLLTSLDSIAWLLNIRGNDIPYTPVNLSYALISKNNKIDLFINLKKIKNVKFKLKKFVNFYSLESINNFFENFFKNSTIGIDKIRSPYFFEKKIKEKSLKIKYIDDPCVDLKSVKNLTELNGARKANIRDGVSFTKFLFWLKNLKDLNKIDERKASEKLLSLRKKNNLFFSLSFETISALNKNSALPHYKITNKSNLKFKKNSIYLIDSGAQYFDGTTDMTRTIIFGKPSKEQKDRFSRVLKGHISVAKSIFKKDTLGSSLDPLARKSLKKINCDYEHGTGHGIGSFLSVHEGPQSISKFKKLKEAKLKEGMIISNEPGFYKRGKYGIRIENLIVVKRHKDNKINFETISFSPIDTNLIDTSLLSGEEVNWLNNYHRKVFNKLSKYLNKKEKNWLKEATKPINLKLY